MKQRNPANNPPACIDHAVRRVPLDRLKTNDLETLTRDFCAGVWGGPGFAYQRRYLEKKYRALEGRGDHLWNKADLEESAYPAGTRIVDHFEVVERAPGKVSLNLFIQNLERIHGW